MLDIEERNVKNLRDLSADEIFEKCEFKKVESELTRGPIKYIYEDGLFKQTITFNRIVQQVKIEQVHDYVDTESRDEDGRLKYEVSFYPEVAIAIAKKCEELEFKEYVL